jgi:NAD(P)-dependent dehydrogenase (short-subunit alcohol dehydrogenase family)
MNQQAQKKSVVVTGAALGIGRAIALSLAEADWAVVGVDMDAEALSRLEREHPSISTSLGDVVEPDTLERATAQAEELAPLEGWVNNAAIPQRGRLDAIDRHVIERTIAVDLTAVVVGCQVAVRSFLRRGIGGSIVNISSIHARVGFPNTPVYDACKGGVEALTRYVSTEYGHRDIRCNAVAPGAVMTDHPRRLIAASADEGRAVIEEMSSLSPSRQIGEPEQIAAAVRFLMSEEAGFISGTTLTVDGGATARCYGFPPPIDI